MEREPSKDERESSLPPRGQRFLFGAFVFNVDKAMAMLEDNQRDRRVLEVGPWASFFGFDITGEHSIALFGPRHLDRDYAMTTNLEDPVIVATLVGREGERFPLVIDGTHRIYRAYVEGVPILPALVLDEAESLSIRDDPFVNSRVHWRGDDPARSPGPVTEGGRPDG
jgi:hypothetical protein